MFVEWIHASPNQNISGKCFHGLYCTEKDLKSKGYVSGCFVIEMKLRSTSSAEQNFPDEINWITWKTQQNLEIWPFLKSDLEISFWESERKEVLLLALDSACYILPTLSDANYLFCVPKLLIFFVLIFECSPRNKDSEVKLVAQSKSQTQIQSATTLPGFDLFWTYCKSFQIFGSKKFIYDLFLITSLLDYSPVYQLQPTKSAG